jgi:hypothetical protein
MFNPSRLRIELLVLALVAGHDAAAAVKHDESGACSALIESA